MNVEKIDQTIKQNIHLFKTAYQKFDLYVLFYEKSFDLLKQHSVLSFITSNKFLSQGYGLLLRQLFLKYTIQQIVNFNYDIFNAATVRTCIMQIKKTSCKENKINIIDVNTKRDKPKFISEKYSKLLQSVFETTEQNNFRINLTTDKMNILSKIQSDCLKIEDICSVNYGLRPSSEKLGLKKEAFIYECPQKSTNKPYFEGKDMGYWLVKKVSYIDYRPDVMYNAMFPELFANQKLVGLRTLSDIGKLRFIYDDKGMFCNDSVVILTLWYLMKNVDYQTITRTITDEKINTSRKYSYQYLQGILNSKLIKFYVNELLYDGTHFYPNHMKSLPIKIATPVQQQPIIALVEKILAAKRQNPQADTTAQEAEIDKLVYELYGLGEEEINVMEGI